MKKYLTIGKKYLKQTKQSIWFLLLLVSPWVYYQFICFSQGLCNATPISFANINDWITSYILLLGFSLALLIISSNLKIIPSNWIIKLVEEIPEFLPFSKQLKGYLLSLIKKNYKIVVLLRSITEDNTEWVLNQIAAYNRILQEEQQINHTKIEYIFIDDNPTDISAYMNSLHTSKYHYIIITSLSKIFQQTIQVREELRREQKDSIKIIGALSSISGKIQKTIDADDNIIRIFPPDYDEASTAIDFLMSKIKSTICINEKCDNYHQATNIIVIHNGTYGAAVKEQAEIAYKRELKKFFHHTNPKMKPTDIEEAIHFHSFDYKSNGTLIYDQITNSDTEAFFKKWENSMNYFYIVGYEPNITHMIEALDKRLEGTPNLQKCLVFCGTLSMTSWRNTVKNTLENSNQLLDTLDYAYYLKLQTYHNSSHKSEEVRDCVLQLYKYMGSGKKESIDLKKEIQKVYPHKSDDKIIDELRDYWKREENYIGIFSKLSMLIAQRSIEEKETLLKSKSIVLYDYKKDIDILMNGDSINHYQCVSLEKS